MRSCWRMSGLLVSLSSIALAAPLMAQTPVPVPPSNASSSTMPAVAPSGALSVAGIFGPGAVRTESVRASRWGKDGESYLALEDAPKGGQDIVRYAIADGQRQVEVAAANLVPPGARAPLGIDSYEWSPDHRWLLIQTNGKRFRRTNALSDYWLYDTTTKRLHQIGGDAAPSTLLYATVSPTAAVSPMSGVTTSMLNRSRAARPPR